MTVLPRALGDDRTINQPDTHKSARTSSIKNLALAPLLGGHSGSDPPDPISNSDVKPASADGTYAQALEE